MRDRSQAVMRTSANSARQSILWSLLADAEGQPQASRNHVRGRKAFGRKTRSLDFLSWDDVKAGASGRPAFVGAAAASLSREGEEVE